MSAYKQLAGQTAIYGLSSIAGRFLNYLLVPLYTRVFDTGDYGIVTQLYAYAAFLNIVFTYGMETAFFRFFQSEKGNTKVYSTSMLSVAASSIILALLIILFSGAISENVISGSGDYSYYIILFAGILACDAITAIPFAKLRQENRAKRFAFLKLVNIGINIALNLFFFVVCPAIIKTNPDSWISSFYDPSFGVGYVFISNFIASMLTLLMMIKEMISVPLTFDSGLWKQMLVYAFPLMIAGFAGMINETFDRILIPYLLSDKQNAMEQLGIYGACYKLSIIMTLFIQTFRYAAEPFFFNHSTKENPQLVYVQVMNYFIITCAFIFLGVMLYIDVVKLFIGPAFRSGLGVVPILLMANLCLGVFYNLSIWYKLTSKTNWGALLSVIGAIVTLAFNFLLIPLMGYMGAAWATLICYASMMILSYYTGKKYYPVAYDIRSFFFYVTLSLIFWGLSILLERTFAYSSGIALTINTFILILFVGLVWANERRKINYLRRVNN